MYKSTSNNSQSRTRRIATEARTNTSGVDPTAYKQDNDLRSELSVQKKKLENKVAQLNAQIAVAKRRYTYKESGQVSYGQLSRWEAERANIKSELTAIDLRLSELKFDRRMRLDQNQMEFGETFKEMAREMLADEVFERILIATIHKIGERE